MKHSKRPVHDRWRTRLCKIFAKPAAPPRQRLAYLAWVDEAVKTEPPVKQEDGQDMWRVAAIVNHTFHPSGKRIFLTAWEGWRGPEALTWEYEADLASARTEIDDYLALRATEAEAATQD